MRRISDKQLETALRNAKGRISAAAHALGCSRQTIYLHVKKSPRLEALLQEITEDFECELLDAAESALLLSITNSEPWAIKYALDKKGKQRGYAETTQHEHSGAQGKPIQVELANLRAALLHDGNYLEYQRARACDADADPRDFRADGEPGTLADESPSASLGSQTD